MARYVSPEICRGLGVKLDCDIVYGGSDNTTVVSFGGIEERQFDGDPDIAGFGVGAFTSFSSSCHFTQPTHF